MDMPTFDELRDLAQRDPEGFETLRTELIEDCIRRSSRRNQRRLRGLQFEIEARRRVAGNPMKALLNIQALMHDSLFRLQQALLYRQCPTEPSMTTAGAGQILPFRRPLATGGSCK